MQKRSNINIKNVRKVPFATYSKKASCDNLFGKVAGISCLGLLLITCLAISPAVAVTTYAVEMAESVSVDDGASLLADDVEYQISTVGITFTNNDSSTNSVSTELTPLDGSGAKSRVSVDANIKVESSSKYSVYIGSDSSYLRKDGTSETDKIAPVDGACQDSQHDNTCTFDAIPVNQWGYAWAYKGAFDSDTATYSAMPETIRGTSFDSNDEPTDGKDERDYTLSFATNIGADKPAGTYSSKVTLSVISSPKEVTVSGLTTITEMQQMTKAVCDASGPDDAAQLKDIRDGKFYWVGKMPDGRCWMTQNLDLDLSTGTTLKGDTTNLAATKDANVTWTPNKSTTSDKDTVLADDTGQLSWSMGGSIGGSTDYYTKKPDSAESCGSQLAGASACSANDVGGWTSMTIPKSANGNTNAHRLLGNHYQWCVATAGCKNSSGQTGSQFTSGEAVADICPYGWRLPTGNTTGEIQALATALGAYTGSTNYVSKLTDSPFYAVRGGFFHQSSNSNKFNGLGNSGYYWSSTVSYSVNAHNFYFSTTDIVNPSSTAARRTGSSVRCINNPNVR